MNTFIYTDNKQKPPKVILVIKANDILEADKECSKILNKPVEKCSYIGCEIKFNS